MIQRKYPKVKTKEETFRKLSFVWFWNDVFEKKYKDIMIYVSSNNTIANHCLNNRIYYDNISNFNSFDDYFLYLLEPSKLNFTHKSDVTYLTEQTKKIIQRRFREQKHLSN